CSGARIRSMGPCHDCNMPRSFALVLLLALLWGGSYPLLKIAVETLPPLTVTAARSVLGGLMLLVALGPTGAREAWRIGTTSTVFATQGLFNCVLPWIFV